MLVIFKTCSVIHYFSPNQCVILSCFSQTEAAVGNLSFIISEELEMKSTIYMQSFALKETAKKKRQAYFLRDLRNL